MYLVYTDEDGVTMITEDREQALREYEGQKERIHEYTLDNGEIDIDAVVIIAKVQRRFHAKDTKEPIEYKENETYWNFVEEIFNDKEE